MADLWSDILGGFGYPDPPQPESPGKRPGFKPLLAATVEDMHRVSFPVLAAPKLDGIRCLIVNGEAVTRSLKPVPNRHIRQALRGLPDLDGELIVGDALHPGAFNATTSGVMSRDGAPDFRFHVFDNHSAKGGFAERLDAVQAGGVVVPVPHTLVTTPAELIEYEESAVAAGWEGVMIRDPGGRYKHGRATLREGILSKVKRFADTEGRVVGIEELQHNGNAQKRNALGLAERSTAKAGLVAGDTLGALIVQAQGWAEPFKIGTGYTAAQRAEYWAERDSLIGRLVKFKYQPAGAKDAPRFPVFIGWRGDE